MRKSLLIVLASIYLFTGTEFRQLLKIPILVEHYFEHLDQNRDLNLTQFLSIHYLFGMVYDSDVARDMELPFKTCDHTCTTIISTEIAFHISYKTYPSYFISSQLIFDDSKPKTDFNTQVWHPPQV